MKKIVVIILVAVIAAVAGISVAIMAVWSAENKVTADFVARANRFAIPADWTQLSDIVRREQFPCLSTNPCPSLSRRWEASGELTLADLRAIASPVGIALKVKGTCQRQANVTGDTSLCSGVGNDGKYVYTLTAVSPGVGEKQELVLNVVPVR